MLGTVRYVLPQVEVEYICWYRLSEVPEPPQPMAILPAPEKTAIRLQPEPLLIDRMDEPVRSCCDNTWYTCPCCRSTINGTPACLPCRVLADGVISKVVVPVSAAMAKK